MPCHELWVPVTSQIADGTYMPTKEDLELTATQNAYEFFTEIRPKPELRRDSCATLLGVKNRGVAEKLERLMEYVLPATSRAYKRHDLDPPQ